ncbi:hypothetical protein BVY03_03870 [bacterium K02(2017)]|nr:hypothetical protein BVY03_03870 [bacterium K02(2017)]
MIKIKIHILFYIILVCLLQCGEAGTRVQNPPTTPTVATSNAYPTSFAISSPLKTSEVTASLNLVTGHLMATSDFSVNTDAINTILNGTSLSQCLFDPSPLLTETTNANCYGPNVNYTNHPDGNVPNSGQLPGGDVGLWTENEINSNEACSAAQQNSLIDGVANKANVSLKALASLICVANVNNIDLPSVGNNITLTDDMTATASVFSKATLSLSTDATTAESIYSYILNFNYTVNGTAIPVSINMEHRSQSSSTETYRGKIYYQFGMLTYSLCNPKASTSGSIIYNKTSSTSLSFDASYAIYCNTVDELGSTPFTASNLLDPTNIFSNTNSMGWQNNYNRFIANFDPSTLLGNYAFAWQAGSGDSHTRAFNLNISSSSNIVTGDAFYGFGPSVSDVSFDARISGFICNWAGPNNSHTLKELVQYQSMTQDSSGLFTASLSDIIYAPTNSCSYTAPVSNQFVFDFDSNNDSVIDQNTASSDITHDLKAVSDLDSDGYLDEITNSGFSLPFVDVF